MPLSRRDFLAGAGVAGALVVGGGWRGVARAAAAKPSSLPAPDRSGIEHIVVLCMENRSFDHWLGWVAHANGRQAGLSYADSIGLLHDTHHLTDWSGCGYHDPDHSYEGGRVQLDNGKLDGFRLGTNDDYALGYYTEADLPTTSQLVRNFTICDNYFCSILGPTYPNRFYTHAATTDRNSNSNDTSTLPTIWDRLAAAGLTGRYYFSDLPFLALWGDKYLPISRPVDTFYADAAAGTLAPFSYLDPFFLGEDQGGSNDDHPHADIRRGQSFVAQVANALMQGPLWSTTVLVVTYDEWGGFFEHVLPPVLPDIVGPTYTVNPVSGALTTWNFDRTQAGFRVPCFVVSPLASPGRVATSPFDHSSILAMVEWRFGLTSLTPRDKAANNLALALDFSTTNPTTSIPAVPDPGPHYCQGYNAVGTGMAFSDPFWLELKDSPQMAAWAGGA